jgi:hypothetical protein
MQGWQNLKCAGIFDATQARARFPARRVGTSVTSKSGQCPELSLIFLSKMPVFAV